MPPSRAEQQRAYPLPAYNFRVTVGGEAMSFRQVSGIEVEHDALTYRHGLSFIEGEEIVTFDFDAFRTVTLERGSAPGAEPRALYDWLRRRDLRRLEISLCDEGGVPVLSWRIARAVPVKVSAPTFDAESNEVAIEKVELKARGITLVEH